MKKLLIVLLALSMVTGAFAAEPIADASVVDWAGYQLVQFGADLTTGKTGFYNEGYVYMAFNFIPSDITATTSGSGVWGELKVGLDGSSGAVADDVASWAGGLSFMTADDGYQYVYIDIAKIHVGDFYFGIDSDDFVYGDWDYYYPNAFNYANTDNGGVDGYTYIWHTNNGPALEGNTSGNSLSNYTQGFVAGYSTGLFSVEANVRSAPDSTSYSLADMVGYPSLISSNTGGGVEYPLVTGGINRRYYYGSNPSNQFEVPSGTSVALPSGETLWEVLYSSTDISNYWSNNYAIGGTITVNPIANLRLSTSVGYGVSGDAEKDFTLWAGTDYVYMLGDTTSIVPMVSYAMYVDNSAGSAWTQNDLGVGVAYRWGPSESATTPFYDFFTTELVYDDNGDYGDYSLLPGVSAYALFDFRELNETGTLRVMDCVLPVMVQVYSGNIAAVPGLKAYGLFHMNVAPKAKEGVLYRVGNAMLNNAELTEVDAFEMALDKEFQAGLAASYALPVGDITVTSTVAGLYKYMATTITDDDSSLAYGHFLPAVQVSVDGLVANTNFTLKWDDAYFNTWTHNDSSVSSNYNGVLTLTATISL